MSDAAQRLTVAWFSGGVSSAVAIKLAIDTIDRICFIDINDHHEDTGRFVQDCEAWFGKPVVTMRSTYRSVAEVCFCAGYINSPHGAPCTNWLKKRPRKEWERQQTRPLRYVWGMDADEADRCLRLRDAMPKQEHICPLVEGGLGKKDAHEALRASGIRRPAMYDLGYHNNNCVGCVKGGMGYWNKIREDFPDVFADRALMERDIGASCITGVYLDELEPDRGRHAPPICDDCGIFCEIIALAQAREEVGDDNAP